MVAAGSPTFERAPFDDPSAGDKQGIERLRERLHAYMEKKGLRSTAQRRLIIDAFFEGSSHMTIEDLLAEVRTREPSIGYATVYRTLKLLAECGVASERHFGDGQTRYEVADGEGHHDHLICAQCGLILEFENDEIEKLQEQMAERLGGFKIVRHKLELYGLCPKAQGVPNGHCPNDARS